MELALSQIPILTLQKQCYLKVKKEQSQTTLASLIVMVQEQYGYSPHAYLYRHPLHPYNTLHFIHPATLLKTIRREYPEILVTLHNPQFIEQHHHIIKSGKEKKTKQEHNWMFVIVQSCQSTYFYHQTFKLSLDCKILFLAGLASRYGRNPSIIYFDFKLPLSLFHNNQTIESSLQTLCFLHQHLIISVDQEGQHQQYYQSVKDPKIVDQDRFYTFAVEGEDHCMVVDRRINWKAMYYILELIFQSKMQVRDRKGRVYEIRSLGEEESIEQMELTLCKKETSRIFLEKPMTQSIFIGSTLHFLCFIQKSSTIHLFSTFPPYSYLSSSLLHSREDEQLQEDLPILHKETLIMYNITRNCIVLKHYTLPQAVLTTTKHYQWKHQEYGGIECESLDLLVVNLRNTMQKRLFYVYEPNWFLDVEREGKVWVAKSGNNSHTDSSGIFAVQNCNRGQVSLYDLKQKKKIDTLELPQLTNISFHTPTQRIIAQLQTTCIEYNYQRKWILHNVSLKPNQLLLYSPKGSRLILTQQHLKNYQNQQQQAQLLGDCLLKDQQAFFVKDAPLRLHSYNYIQEIPSKNMKQRKD